MEKTTDACGSLKQQLNKKYRIIVWVKEAADVSPKFISFIFLKIMIIKSASLGVLQRLK
jgi:hypothetical protein